MAVLEQYEADVETIRSKRHDNGADFWATPDGRWGTGSPFSTFDCIVLLTEVGLERSDPILRGAGTVLFDTWREDGRFRPAPKATMYPCHTANAVRALCRLGHVRDRRIQRSFEHLASTQAEDGGWRCNTMRLGKSPTTDASNPGVTLSVLDGLRFRPPGERGERVDAAVGTLLAHWNTRTPLGPCAFGIGSRFAKTEYPFLRYNLFFYVYVLSFFEAARRSPEFQAALGALEEKLVGDQLVVESPNRRLAKLAFCRKGEPSLLATVRYAEIRQNVALDRPDPESP